MGSGPDVIFLHGWGGDKYSLYPIALFFAADYRVTLPDLYGFGDTAHPDYTLTIDDYVLSVVALIRHYNMKDVTLVCHSFGGRIGIKLTAKYGYYVRNLILTDAAGIKSRFQLKRTYRIIRHKILDILHIKHAAGSLDYQKTCGTMRETFKNVVNEDMTNHLEKIQANTLIVWGNKDKDTPIYMAKKIYRKVGKSTLVIFRGCGHFAYLEKRDIFCEITERFVANGCLGQDYFRYNCHRGVRGDVSIFGPRTK